MTIEWCLVFQSSLATLKRINEELEKAESMDHLKGDRSDILKALKDFTNSSVNIGTLEKLNTKRSVKTAPKNLLSLKDMTVIQSMMEVCICWMLYPGLPDWLKRPVEKRHRSKSFKVSLMVMQGLSKGDQYCKEEMMDIIQVLSEVMWIEEVRSFLVSMYVEEFTAFVMYIQVHEEYGTQDREAAKAWLDIWQRRIRPIEHIRMYQRMVYRWVTKLKVEKSGDKYVQQLLATTTNALTMAVMRPNGIEATILACTDAKQETSVDHLEQLANLFMRVPKNVGSKEYYGNMGHQLGELLMVDGKMASLLHKTAIETICKWTISNPMEADQLFYSWLLQPILSIMEPLETGDRSIVVHGHEIEKCLSQINTLLFAPPSVHTSIQAAILPTFRPLLHLYAFTQSSISNVKQMCKQVLIGFLERFTLENAELALESALFAGNACCRPNLQRIKISHAKHVPALGFDDQGGVSVSSTTELVDSTWFLDMAQERIDTIMLLLQEPVVKETNVVGTHFVNLMRTFVTVQYGEVALGEKNVDQDEKANYRDIQKAKIKQLKTMYTDENKFLVFQSLASICETFGSQVLTHADQILPWLLSSLAVAGYDLIRVENSENDGPSVDDIESVNIVLGFLLVMLDGKSTTERDMEAKHWSECLVILNKLALSKSAGIPDLAIEVYGKILCSKKASTKNSLVSPCDIIAAAEADIASTVVPTIASGVVSLTRLVRSKPSCNYFTSAGIYKIMDIYIQNLTHHESYVYLAAVQGLAALGDHYACTCIKYVAHAFCETKRCEEQRIKLGEALTFIARRCGETLPTYTSLLIRGYLAGIRPTGKNKSLENSTLRASCLSNLAEICSMLQWSLQGHFVDIITGALGVLEMEKGCDPTAKIVRRGAAFLLDSLIRTYEDVELLDFLPRLQSVLSYTEVHDFDEATRIHASNACKSIENILKPSLIHEY